MTTVSILDEEGELAEVILVNFGSHLCAIRPEAPNVILLPGAFTVLAATQIETIQRAQERLNDKRLW